MLPLPSELIDTNTDKNGLYHELAMELRALGESLKERQLQPIVVYPGSSEVFPAARYLILVGHRRWTAAALVGLESLDALVVEPPSDAERVRFQYIENEDREEFSDIERMWAIDQLWEALGRPAWREIEGRLKLSTARREQLRRLRVFTPAQQRIIALLGAQETQLRPLHSALRDGKLTEKQADDLLARLVEISEMRLARGDGDAGGIDVTSQRTRIDGPTIARLVAQAINPPVGGREPTPRWLASFQKNLGGAKQALQQVHGQVPEMPAPTAEQVLTELEQLVAEASHLAEAVRRRRDVQADEA